ncbi:hypothetical protein MMG00_12095 [Ignatzschineria rhizosphaerae]|uniref:DUF1989 domain-containing protein n=1 Tax=Ignatzschineria rhizosphaerae TaxID=2923279 RepID=A0ABY3X597_9GAMM|nr:hypothetical protein [Ignatzschineria rhizosphaerae]UNM95926.1 hypothetical protein MMG00_12095 [Ignatzschineria rhizosphaerae]
MSKVKPLSRPLTLGDIKAGAKIVRLESRIERFWIRGIKNGWAFFTDGHCAEISYMVSDNSPFRLDLVD